MSSTSPLSRARSFLRTLLAIGGLLAACSSSDPKPGPDGGTVADTANPAPDAAAPDGVPPATDSAGPAPDASRVDAGGQPPDGGSNGTAVAKFCNALTQGGMDFEASIEIGDAAPVRLTAISGTCSSRLGQACQTVPAGMPTVTLFQGAQRLGALVATIMPDRELVLILDLNAMNQPALFQLNLGQGGTCANVDPFLPPPDGGPPPPGDGAAPRDTRPDGGSS
jgi:hypothetical protein